MPDTTWTRLRAPFPPAARSWFVAEIDPAGEVAVLRPTLSRRALAERLDEVVGPEAWSLRFAAAEGAVVATLEIGEVARSAVVDVPGAGGLSLERAADVAVARAAELFGMGPGDVAERRVPYDPHTGDVLSEDDIDAVIEDVGAAVEGVPRDAAAAGADARGADVDEGDTARTPDLAQAAAEARGVPAEGQRMIDRLVERLKEAGQGLPAARLLVRYGGYGKDPAAARELYRELRELLMRTGVPPEPKG